MSSYTIILDGYRNFPVASSITKFLMPEFYSTAYAVQTPANVHLIQLPDPCFKKLRVICLSSVSSCEIFVLFSSPVVLKKETDDCRPVLEVSFSTAIIILQNFKDLSYTVIENQSKVMHDFAENGITASKTAVLLLA